MAEPELTCQAVVELVTAYLEDALDPVTRARVEEHLSGCDGCIAYLEQMRVTISLTGRVGGDELSGEAQRTLLDAFRDWHRREPAR
jgi:predicted anti-sigma-YlaC factor YlaD